MGPGEDLVDKKNVEPRRGDGRVWKFAQRYFDFDAEVPTCESGEVIFAG